MNMPFVWAITGGIGSGKSVVANIFYKLGIPIFDCDKKAKELYNSDSELKQFICEQFGADLYNAEGLLLKNKLADIIFSDAAQLALLEKVVHKKVLDLFDNWCITQNYPVLALESAILFKTELPGRADAIIVVDAPIEERIRRVQLRDHTTQEAIYKRMQHQFFTPEPFAHKVYTINNSGTQPILPYLYSILQKHKTFFINYRQ